MERVAYSMQLSGRYTISASEAIAAASAALPLTSAADLQGIAFDVTNCSFLNRDSEGNYVFMHKSFQEYFVASLLARWHQQGDLILKEYHYYEDYRTYDTGERRSSGSKPPYEEGNLNVTRWIAGFLVLIAHMRRLSDLERFCSETDVGSHTGGSGWLFVRIRESPKELVYFTQFYNEPVFDMEW